MAWRVLALLSVLVGCDLPDLPKTVHVHDRFSPEERELVEEAIRETNAVLIRPCLGFDGLLLGEPLVDPDGFDPDGSDYGDGVHGIYKLYPDEAAYETLSCIAGRDFGGNATLQDVLMVRNLDDLDALEEEDAEAVRAHFKRVIRHELGHHLGLTHHPDPSALMYAGEKTADTFSGADREAFAFVRGCSYP